MTTFPSWRTGPNGERRIFQKAEDVPDGWVDGLTLRDRLSVEISVVDHKTGPATLTIDEGHGFDVGDILTEGGDEDALVPTPPDRTMTVVDVPPSPRITPQPVRRGRRK